MTRNLVIIGAVANAVAFSCGFQYDSIKKFFRKSYCEAETVQNLISQQPSIKLPQQKIEEAIRKSSEVIENFRTEHGIPGLVIGVTINGESTWQRGFGLSDVENGVKCHAGTVMRIASISKSMTMAVVAKLWEERKLDLDQPVQHYVPDFPEKTFQGEKVKITTRQLVSHMAGIRHYKDPKNSKENSLDKKKNAEAQVQKNDKNPEPIFDSSYSEFMLSRKFRDVKEAMTLFKDDELVSKPGNSFLYTTHGWTLISAVVESVTKEPITNTMTQFFKVMGLKNTYLELHEPIIYNRSRYYMKNKQGRLQNAPYVDVSYKWAGGGFLSNVSDLLQFGNAMLYCSQHKEGLPPGYLSRETVSSLWKVCSPSPMHWGRDSSYGMGWVVVPARKEYAWGDNQRLAVGHAGGAVGASSVLVIVPISGDSDPPEGITVAVLANLQDISLHRLAFSVADFFAK